MPSKLDELVNELMGKLFTVWSGSEGVSAQELKETILKHFPLIEELI